jgi:hypothetical protein
MWSLCPSAGIREGSDEYMNVYPQIPSAPIYTDFQRGNLNLRKSAKSADK